MDNTNHSLNFFDLLLIKVKMVHFISYTLILHLKRFRKKNIYFFRFLLLEINALESRRRNTYEYFQHSKLMENTNMKI